MGVMPQYADPDAERPTTFSVIDNLTSTSTTDALSANQGKVLKGLIDAAFVSPGSVSGNGSTVYTMTNSSKVLFCGFSAGAQAFAMLMINVSSSGSVVVTDVVKGSAISYTTATRKITVSNSNTNTLSVRCIVLDGSITT